MRVTWTKDEMKQYFLLSHQTKTLLHDKENQLILEMEVDVFNEQVFYNITDGFDIIYATFWKIEDAIDKFYEMKEDKNYE